MGLNTPWVPEGTVADISILLYSYIIVVLYYHIVISLYYYVIILSYYKIIIFIDMAQSSFMLQSSSISMMGSC